MLFWSKEKKNMIFLGRENNISLWNQIVTAKSARVKRQIRIKEMLWTSLELVI